MRSGPLRHLVTIQTATNTSDGMGGYTQSWTDTATVWGEVLPLRGTEKLTAMQLESKVTHKFRIRFYSGLTPKNRLKFNSRYFDISEVINVSERSEVMELLAVETL